MFGFARLVRFAEHLQPFFNPEGGGGAGAGGEGAGSGAGAGEGGAGGAGEGKGSGEGSGAGDGKSGGDKGAGDKTLTEAEAQAKIDAAVKDRLAREKKKTDKALTDLQKQLDVLSGKTPEGGEGATGDAASQEALRTAKDLVAKANTALLSTAAQAEAMKLGVDPKFLVDAVKLADLSGAMDEEGVIDTKKVSAAVDAVVKRVPAFKASQEGGNGGFKVGGEGGQGGGQKGGNGWGQKGGDGQAQSQPKRWNRWN